MRLPALSLRPGDRAVLESWCRAGTVEARFAKRARIVLLAADGVTNRDIGELVDMHYNQVAVWRRRYAELGVAGLGDEERPGRPCVYDHDDVLLLVKTVTEPPPDGATRWTMEALAAVMNGHGVPISASQVWRICRALDLKPWQVQSWMTTHDPGLLGAGRRRVRPLLAPAGQCRGVVGRREDRHAGHQPGQPDPSADPRDPGAPRVRVPPSRHRRAVRRLGRPRRRRRRLGHRLDPLGELRCLPRRPRRPDPAGLDLHCIVDNLKTHSTELVDTFLAQHPHVHLHFTPTHASWLNQVELFLSILQRRLLRYGEFNSVDDLADRIIAFIKDYNRRAAPFRWTYDGRPLKVA